MGEQEEGREEKQREEEKGKDTGKKEKAKGHWRGEEKEFRWVGERSRNGAREVKEQEGQNKPISKTCFTLKIGRWGARRAVE
jgi:hypothetical protein